MRRVAAVAAVALVAAAPAGASAPGFAIAVSRVAAADLRYSYRPGCPVPPAQLRLVRLRYWGFDGVAHTGELVVNRRVVADVRAVFARLFAARFPIRRMRTVDAYRGRDAASMAADNTSAFNCRAAVAAGPRRWSMHAYGEAIDVNPVENPYVLGGVVRPRAGRRFAARDVRRPGMAVEGGPLVRAFAAVGWGWGGRWGGSPDFQHFSTTGR